ncbi:MAG TPA: hypothetical protein VFP46_02685 [Candidatus Paceibacterota bacterium]|nr:hypothetical protein [Candidatus Paceibacterota bacterium]
MPLTQWQKAEILDTLFPLILQNMNSAGIIRFLRGDGFDDVEFYPNAEDELFPALVESFMRLKNTEALFKQYLGEALASELGAQSIKIKW